MSPSVLVVENHDDLRKVIVATLARQQYRCDAVANASEAMLRVRQHDYAYVVVDLDSPRSTEELMTLLAAEPHLARHVVVITEGDLAEINVYGDDQMSFLRKPFGRKELLAQFGHSKRA